MHSHLTALGKASADETRILGRNKIKSTEDKPRDPAPSTFQWIRRYATPRDIIWFRLTPGEGIGKWKYDTMLHVRHRIHVWIKVGLGRGMWTTEGIMDEMKCMIKLQWRPGGANGRTMHGITVLSLPSMNFDITAHVRMSSVLANSYQLVFDAQQRALYCKTESFLAAARDSLADCVGIVKIGKSFLTTLQQEEASKGRQTHRWTVVTEA